MLSINNKLQHYDFEQILNLKLIKMSNLVKCFNFFIINDSNAGEFSVECYNL